MTDPIADMLIRIKNAQARNHAMVIIPGSKIKFALAKILEREGFINGVTEQKQDKKNNLEIILKYNEGIPAIEEIKRISKSSRRFYVGKEKIPCPLSGYGIAIISTSKGLLTDAEARRKKIGGEVICEVW
jgi:small subunit ribosomal protein S8